MPTPTYNLIDSEILVSSASSVEFASIPSTFRDLIVVISPISVSGTIFPVMRFNSDTGINYASVVMSGTGSAAQSFSNASRTSIQLAQNAGVGTASQYVGITQIFDYSATDKHKSVLHRANNPISGAGVDAMAERWASTSVITSITVSTSGTFGSGSTFYLYGVAA